VEVVDLTLSIYEGMPQSPMHPRGPVLLSGTLQHRMTRRWMGDDPEHGPVSFSNEQIVLSGHTGTHIDAPVHAVVDGGDAGSIELSSCVGPATMLDVRDAAATAQLIPLSALVTALGTKRELASIVLLHTGWTRMLSTDPDRYYRDSVGIDDDAASWLRSRGVRCVGIDAPSIDAHSAPGARAHMRFLRESPPVYIIENLCRLDLLPEEIPFFSAAPLPLVGSSGSPVRAYAVLD
jgi:kynurenine formamidase